MYRAGQMPWMPRSLRLLQQPSHAPKNRVMVQRPVFTEYASNTIPTNEERFEQCSSHIIPRL
jgi:hypothetical protein